jgi:hypothetical protein
MRHGDRGRLVSRKDDDHPPNHAEGAPHGVESDGAKLELPTGSPRDPQWTHDRVPLGGVRAGTLVGGRIPHVIGNVPARRARRLLRGNAQTAEFDRVGLHDADRWRSADLHETTNDRETRTTDAVEDPRARDADLDSVADLLGLHAPHEKLHLHGGTARLDAKLERAPVSVRKQSRAVDEQSDSCGEDN